MIRAATRLRSRERRAGAAARARALCKLCGGQGRHNARTIVHDYRCAAEPQALKDPPPEPGPGCGKVRLMEIHLRVVPRIEGPPTVIVGEGWR
jgi:hypothetical protein